MFVIEGVSEDVKHSILCRERRTWFYFPNEYRSKSISTYGIVTSESCYQQDRRQYDQSFKIDNGDFLQGSPFCNYLIAHSGGRPTSLNFIDQMAFDFGTLGNHR